MDWALVSTSLPALSFFARLREKGIDAYCPVLMRKRSRGGRRRAVITEKVPAYPGYVFVRMSEVKQLRSVGVKRYKLVHFGEELATIADAEIERLRALEREWEIDQSKEVTLYANARVIISEGLFKDQIATVIGFTRYVATISLRGATIKLSPSLLRLLDF